MRVLSLCQEDPLEGRAWQPTSAFLPGESMDRGARWAAVHGKELDTTEATWHACTYPQEVKILKLKED